MSWISLFSGGKDSTYALMQALQSGLDVSHLVTVHPAEGSYMYHVPMTELTQLSARTIGIDLIDVDPGNVECTDVVDSSGQGDREIVPLEDALADLAPEGIIVGAVESEYQHSRITRMADRVGAKVFDPLWQCDPIELGEDLVTAGIEIRIVQVSAGGLDRSWLGRKLDQDALEELKRLHESIGIHPLGEGGEYETFVVDGPHMDRRIEIEYTSVWEGDRGRLEIESASLS
ncbi:MAG: diphthine--ammonia ligase [Halobacteriaceae archaeon]